MAFEYDLRSITRRNQLLIYIGIEESVFDWVCNFSVAEYESSLKRYSYDAIATIDFMPFCQHSIPKRNSARGDRIVWEAESNINNIYKGLSRRLTHFFQTVIPNFPHPKCCGYVQNRNIRDNAQFHVGMKNLLKADIENFFPTITRDKMVKFFNKMEVNEDIAEELSNFLTIDGRLPLGLPTSPTIANAICHGIDLDLEEVATKAGSIYSRYADDLTFSSNKKLPNILDVSNALKMHGFNIAKDKTRYSKRGQSHYVTGLSISDIEDPRAPRKMKRALKQDLYFAQKNGLSDHIKFLGIRDRSQRQRYINHLDGMVKYISYHEPRLSNKIVPLWQKILLESGDKPSFEPKNQDRLQFYFFVDETEFTWKGKEYLALGLSASQHQEQIDIATQTAFNNYLANPWSDGNLQEIRKKGVHFTDATEDLRRIYIETLQPLPFNGYIVFGELGEDYQETYLRLLRFIIKRRLMASESKAAIFLFEKTSKVSENAIKSVMNAALEDLRKTNNRRPKYVFTKFVGKEHYGVSVPDFLLAVFRRYINSDPLNKSQQRQINMFEMLRDKIRLIVNADTGEEFSRRNPV